MHGSCLLPALAVAFVLPVVYAMYYADIDRVIGLAEQKINTATAAYAVPCPCRPWEARLACLRATG